jgi:DNA-binding response OmpR family regulator
MPLILIIEDEPDTADLIAFSVTQLGYQARVAGTAALGVAAARAEPPDAILLDILLPDASRTGGLEQLRNVAPNVPIIMLTANTDAAIARDSLKRGAFDYITKPFDIERLKSVLDAALASSS